MSEHYEAKVIYQKATQELAAEYRALDAYLRATLKGLPVPDIAPELKVKADGLLDKHKAKGKP